MKATSENMGEDKEHSLVKKSKCSLQDHITSIADFFHF